jgi:hypothetical protein
MLTSSDSTRDLVLKKRLSVCRLMLLTKHYLSSVVESKLCGLVHLLQIRFNMLFNLFMLQAYSLNTLTDVQRNAIRDLAELGLVKLQQGRKDSWFIPTKLATNLSASLSDSSSNKEVSEHFISLLLQLFMTSKSFITSIYSSPKQQQMKMKILSVNNYIV